MLDEQLRKILNIEMSYPGITIGYELWALESAVDVMEVHLPQVRDQYRLRAEHAVWSNPSLSDEEIPHELQQIEEVVSGVIPQYVRNPGVISAWALLESAVEDIGDFVARRECIDASFATAKGRTFRAKFRYHFETTLGMKVPVPDSDWLVLGRLQKFRNVVVHRNGRIDAISDKKRQEFTDLANITAGVKLARDRLAFSPEYTSKAIGAVRRCISALDAVVAMRYDWAHMIRE